MSNPTPRVAAAMIVRNEVKHLRRVFDSTRGLADHVVVVDTGSTDGTVRLAQDLGATVIEDAWDDDFSRSRNLSLEAAEATGAEWILVLDGDDVVEGAAVMRRSLDDGVHEDVLVARIDSAMRVDGPVQHESIWQPRFFRASAGVRYRFPVHNIPVIDGLSVGRAPGRIVHSGYTSAAARTAKAERTLRLLPKLPEGHPHRLHHELRALSVLERHGDVCELGPRLLAVVPRLPPDVRLLWGRAELAEGRPHRAAELLVDGLKDHPHHPDLFYGLLTVAGVGYAGASLKVRRDGGLFDGAAVTLHREARVVDALVRLGVLDPAARDLVARDDRAHEGKRREAGAPRRSAAEART